MLRSTLSYRFLTGDIESSKEDLLESIKLVPSFTQSLVKIASVYMEQNDQEKTFECFDEAIKQNSDDPDIYYHRGQGTESLSSPTLNYRLVASSAVHHERFCKGCREL